MKKKLLLKIFCIYQKFHYVFTTGGIGPTHDDITAKSISKAFKVKYEYHEEAYSILEKYYGKKNLMMEEKNGKNAKRLQIDIQSIKCRSRFYN